ncbi:MAG: radical SAM protein [Candidatus Omnitrophica bacterium]|nr:radical SAM protein [Candidatus Omnitrophota bacterium]
MTKKQNFQAMGALLKAKFLAKGTPLLINWAITYKCNNQCLYCKIAEQKVEELETSQIIKLIDVLHKENSLMINFTGGEPLVHPDIDKILQYTAEKGISIILNTNGILLSEKESLLDYVQTVKLSFDGPMEIHDKLRGKGTFVKAIQAIETVEKSKAKLMLCTVLSQYNLDSIEYILNATKKLDSLVFFQPITPEILGSAQPNPLLPEIAKYRKAIDNLLELKRSKSLGKYIANSYTALKYLYDWPNVRKINCAAGLLFAHISADGYLMRCARNAGPCRMEKLDPKHDFRESFEMLRKQKKVPCYCTGMLEFNSLLELNLESSVNLLKKTEKIS